MTAPWPSAPDAYAGYGDPQPPDNYDAPCVCGESAHPGIACDAIPDAREDRGHGLRNEDAA